MGSDDLTKELPDGGPRDRTTQPMMQELITEIRAMREKISAMESSFEGVREKISGIESGFDAMREKISGMESGFDSIALRFNAVDARLDRLETNVLRDIKGLGNSLGELRDTMDALNRRSLNTDRDVSRVQTRLDELEGTKAS